MGDLINNISQAIITLGGKGTRLSSITDNIPKPLWPILGKHTLERTVEFLNKQGIKEFIFLVGYKANIFEEQSIKLSKKFNIKIFIYKEDEPKGEAGSLLFIEEKLKDNFIFINGDIIFEIDLKRINLFHIKNNADITFITHLTNHPEDSDCIIETPELSINRYKLKTQKLNIKGMFLGFAGIAVLKKKVVSRIKNSDICKNSQLSIFKDFIINSYEKGFKVFSYNTSEYLKDMGTPERLLSVEKDIKNGLISRKCYLNKQRALFLDRDNTLIKCKEGEYITELSQIKLFTKRIKKIIQILTNYDIAIIASNQPQIAMGFVEWQKVIEINGYLIKACQKIGLNISAFYICPHHPHKGFDHEIKSLKSNCFCRKPSPGMFMEAAFERNINLEESSLIGDSWRDELSSNLCRMRFINVDQLDS